MTAADQAGRPARRRIHLPSTRLRLRSLPGFFRQVLTITASPRSSGPQNILRSGASKVALALSRFPSWAGWNSHPRNTTTPTQDRRASRI